MVRAPIAEHRRARGLFALHASLERGMTLIEILIVMALMSVMVSVVVAGSGQLSSARLKHSSVMIAGAIRVAYAHSNATSRSVRLVFDMTEHKYWLEEGDRPMLVQSKDTSATGGAEAATVAEKQGLEEKDRIQAGPSAPKSQFKLVETPGMSGAKGPRELARGIHFREVQATHDDEPRKEGRAYLYFWPGGQTERAVIQLAVGDSKEDNDTQSLVVSPLTGKVEVKSGPIALKIPRDDKEASEREEPGGLW